MSFCVVLSTSCLFKISKPLARKYRFLVNMIVECGYWIFCCPDTTKVQRLKLVIGLLLWVTNVRIVCLLYTSDAADE